MKKCLFIVLVISFLNFNCDSSSNESSDPLDEGSIANPKQIEIGLTHNGTISTGGVSYYKFEILVTGDYAITLSDTESDLAWNLFDDKSFNNLIHFCDDYFNAANESDDVFFTSTGTYYLSVEEFDGHAGTFSLIVAEIP